MIAALDLIGEGLVRQVLGGRPVLARLRRRARADGARGHESAVAEMLGDRERLLGTKLAGGAITAQALHLRQPEQRHRLDPDEPAGVLFRCGAEPAARLIEFAEGGVGERDAGVEARQDEADTGGDHAAPARLESLERLDRLSPRRRPEGQGSRSTNPS